MLLLIGHNLKISFAHGVVRVRGMKYLHSLQPPVIHSDLKSKNVLISNALVAKVSYYYSVLCLDH